MPRRSLDFLVFRGCSFPPCFWPFFLALLFVMLFLGLNHLGYLLLYSWFFCFFLSPKNIEGPRWLVHYFSPIIHLLMQNSGSNYAGKCQKFSDMRNTIWSFTLFFFS